MLAVERRRPRLPAGLVFGKVIWTFVFSIMAAVNGASLARGDINGVGATSFLAILGWLVVYWRTGVLVLIGLSCTDGFIKLYHSGFVTLILKDMTVASIILGITAAVATNPKIVRGQRWAGAGVVIFYMSFEAIEILNPGAQKAAALAGFRAHAFFCTLFFVGALYLKSRDLLTRTIQIAIGGITFACAMGIVQYVAGPAWSEIGQGFANASKHFVTQGGGADVAGQSNTIQRVYGTLVDPTALGLAAAFGMIYAFGQLVGSRTWPARIWLGSATFVMFVALLLSGTRAAIAATGVGFIVLLAVLAIRPETRRFIFAAVLLALVAVPAGVYLTSGATSSRFTDRSTQLALETRQRSAGLVFAAIKQQPFGVGLGSAGAGGKAREKQKGVTLAIDNLYLSALYETGPLGVLALAVMQLTILFLTWRAAMRAESIAIAATFAAMGAAQVALLASGFLNQGALDYAPIAQMFWLFAGAVTMPQQFEERPAIVADAAPRTVVPLRDRFPKRLRAIATFGRRAVVVDTAPVAPAPPISDAEIDAALDRFHAHMRANLAVTDSRQPFALRDGDELLRRASRQLFMRLKRAMAAADADPTSAEKARRVVRDSADVAAMMLALSEKYGAVLRDETETETDA